ncbi:MAG: hypothetical protein Hens3KO_07250 [Henriciella sp.]
MIGVIPRDRNKVEELIKNGDPYYVELSGDITVEYKDDLSICIKNMDDLYCYTWVNRPPTPEMLCWRLLEVIQLGE